ncbi:MAG: tetratricopeptide repeat protein [Chitinophagales bacterium]|nr:tetratricopeptide repeat protein [Chitinophagales bacterium]MCZ2392729.1 tetratricopeptide repeat protein [Chitinophagales bacterium]
MCIKTNRIIKLLIFILLLHTTSAWAESQFVNNLIKDIEDSYLYNPQRVLSKSKELLEYGLKNQDSRAIAYGYFQMGVGNFIIGKVRISSDYFNKSLQFPYTENDISLKGKNLKGLAINADFNGDVNKSLSLYQEALKLFESVNDSTEIAWIWNGIGLLDSKILQFANSEVNLKKAHEYFKRTHQSKFENITLQNISGLYIKMGKYDDALKYANESLSNSIRYNNKIGEVQQLINISSIYNENGNKEKAISYLENALKKAQVLQLEDMIANIYMILATVKNNNPSQTLQYITDAKNIFKKNENNKQLLETYYLEMDYYARIGDTANYSRAKEQFKKAQAQIMNQYHIESYEDLKALYELDKKEGVIALQKASLKIRNYWIFFFVILSLALLAFSFIFYKMYIRIKEYAYSLYKINIELKSKNNPLGKVIAKNEASTTNSPEIEEKVSELEIINNIDSENQNDKFKILYDEIIAIIEHKKLYTQHSLSISSLSRELNSNDKYISQAINTYSNSNFTTLINNYRIQEAQNLIEEHLEDITIKDLASRAGFNSINTFYKKFKDATGLTPSIYIEMALKEKRNSLVRA